jgi:predicted nucleotidyltransferase
MSISSLLFSEYRRRVLGLLLLQQETPYHVREIARLTGTSAGSLHRELSKLASAGVLIRKKSGNQVYYQANTEFPIFQELRSILKKTSGLVDVIMEALVPFAENLDAAFIFGSVAKGSETLRSDIDLLIIGNIDFAQAVTTLYPLQETLGREINPKIYSKKEWKQCIIDKNLFVQEILNGPQIFIIGTINDIR